LLTSVGLQELVAHSVGEYVKIATDLGAEPRRLSELRESMRARIEGSPLRDEQAFTRQLRAFGLPDEVRVDVEPVAGLQPDRQTSKFQRQPG